jgi:tetratricopeptide (TPR) repeat protein
MKKIIFVFALFAVAASASAQDKIVRKARELKNEIQDLVANPERTEKETMQMNMKLAQCMEMIEPTLTSPDTKKELANAWDIKAQLHSYILSPLLDKAIAKQETDTAQLAQNIYASLDAIQKCFEATQALGLKGEKDQYTMANKLNVIKFRPIVAYCGQMFFQNQQFPQAVDAFKRWMNYPTTYTILGDDAQTMAEDDQTPQIAYYTCLAAYFGKDYATVSEFMPQARKYTQEKNQVNQLYLTSIIEQGDTATWLKAAQEVVLEDPESNDGVAQNVLAYYFTKGDFATAGSFVDKLLETDATSKLGNYAKGLVFMNDHKYLDAITYFDKAIEADPEYSDAYYNAGVCYSNHGYDINDGLTGKKMTQQQYNAAVAPVREAYRKAEPYFLKVKELEPDNAPKWASRLATVYYILEDKAKQKEYEKLAGY